jgi:hypothetical protein
LFLWGDRDSGLAATAHVLEVGDTVYAAVLALSDTATGVNSYYKLQVLESDRGNAWSAPPPPPSHLAPVHAHAHRGMGTYLLTAHIDGWVRACVCVSVGERSLQMYAGTCSARGAASDRQLEGPNWSR